MTPGGRTGAWAEIGPAATPPVVTAEKHSPLMVSIAVVVLVAAGLLIARLVRTSGPGPADTAPPGEPPPPPAGSSTTATDAVVLMVVVGEAMLDSGYDVDSVRSAVADIAAVHGVPRAEIITMPTAMFASALADGTLETTETARRRPSPASSARGEPGQPPAGPGHRRRPTSAAVTSRQTSAP